LIHSLSALALIILLIFSEKSSAQNINGTISDSNGEPIPFQRIYIKNTNNGAVTNLKGFFQIDVPKGIYTLVINSIDYKDTSLIIDHQSLNTSIDIHLSLGSTNLASITVNGNGKDPAYAIIKQAINRRKSYLNQYQTYSYDTYIKSTIENEFEATDSITNEIELSKRHLNFIESVSTTYFKAPNQLKQVVKAITNHTNEVSGSTFSISISQENSGAPIGSSHNPDIFRSSTIDPGFNFYNNLIKHPSLNSTPYTSPIASTALLSYAYALEDSWIENNKLIYKIRVIPKRKMSATFEGHIYIEDQTFALYGIDLNINPKALFRYNSFHINQQFITVNDSVKVLKKEIYYLLDHSASNDMFSKTVMMHSNHIINPIIKSNFFKNELKSTEEDAYEKDSIYWVDHRPIELKQEEIDFISYQDSIVRHQESSGYRDQMDSTYNRVKFLDFIIFGVGFRNWTKKTELLFEPILGQVRPFGVGGYRHALPVSFRKEWKRGYALDLRVAPDYGFKNKDLKGSIDVNYTYLPKRFSRVHFAISDAYRIINDYESISAYFSRSNYVRTKGIILGHSMEFFNGFYADIDIEYQKNSSISSIDLSAWSDRLFGQSNVPEAFDPFTELYLDIRLNYRFKQKFYNEPYRKIILESEYPKITLWYKKGIKGLLNSVVNFDLLELHLYDDFQIGTFGISKWDVHVGDFFNNKNVMLTNNKFFRGSDRYFFSNPLLSFQLIGPSITTENGYFQANYVHHFHGALMNKIPLINKLKLEAVAGGGLLLLQDNSLRHMEVYVGLEKPFRLFKETFKIGIYSVTADSNHSKLNTGFKVGIDVFNAFTKKWSY